jgi:hypothetical protein
VFDLALWTAYPTDLRRCGCVVAAGDVESVREVRKPVPLEKEARAQVADWFALDVCIPALHAFLG